MPALGRGLGGTPDSPWKLKGSSLPAVTFPSVEQSPLKWSLTTAMVLEDDDAADDPGSCGV
tara:strand:- start:175 stop:357 length:183 start_codon:yes stop_codon:yes gene_type:complete